MRLHFSVLLSVLVFLQSMLRISEPVSMISNKSDMIFRAFLHWLPMPTFKSKKVFNINVQGPSSVRLETALQCMVFLRQSVPSLQFFNITKLFLGEWRRCFSCQIFVFLPQIGEISRSLYG